MPDTPVISDVRAAVYVIPTDAPEADGTLAWDETTLVLVTAAAGGQEGIGWTYAAGAAAAVVTDVLAGVVTGRSAFDIPGAAEAMARALRNIGRRGVAAHGDVRRGHRAVGSQGAAARPAASPTCSGGPAQHVPVYGSGGFTSYDEQQTREQLTGWVDGDGIPRVKIKIGESWGGRRAPGPGPGRAGPRGHRPGHRAVRRRQRRLHRRPGGAGRRADGRLRRDLVRGAGVLAGPGRAGRGPAPGPARRRGRRVQLVAGRLGRG